MEYLNAFADSRLVHRPGAEHNLHEGDPAGVVAAVRASHTGRPVPSALDDPSAPPADHQT